MWQGSGGIFGVLAGLLAIALVVVGVLSMTGSMSNMNMGSMSADKLTGFLGLGVAAFGFLKFIFALTESPGLGGVRRTHPPGRDRLGRLAEGGVERRLPDGRHRGRDDGWRDPSSQRASSQRASSEHATDRAAPAERWDASVGHVGHVN